jgi:hypothetical protein
MDDTNTIGNYTDTIGYHQGDNQVQWNYDMNNLLDLVNTNTLVDAQSQYYRNGNFAGMQAPQQLNGIEAVFGSRTFFLLML